MTTISAAYTRTIVNTYDKMISDIINSPPHGWTFVNMNDAMTELHFTLTGAEPPYDKRVFNVTVTYSDDDKKKFPFVYRLPLIHFDDNVFHCNIDASGFMRLIDDVTAATRLQHILANVLCILSNPDPHCLTNDVACNLFLTDRQGYDMLARDTV